MHSITANTSTAITHQIVNLGYIHTDINSYKDFSVSPTVVQGGQAAPPSPNHKGEGLF